MINWAKGPGTSRYPKLWDGYKVGFAPCLGGAGRNIPDMAHSRYPFTFAVASGAARFTWISSPIGSAVRFTGGNSYLAQTATNAPCKFCTNAITDNFTIQSYFRFTHSGSASESTLYWSDNPAVAESWYGYRLYVDNNADTINLQVANGDDMVTFFPTYYPSNTVLTGGKWYSVVMVWMGAGRDGADADRLIMYIDGVDDGYLSFTPSVTSGVEEYCSHSGTQVPRIGSTLNSNAPGFDMSLLNIWNRALTPREVGIISADPRAMFRRRRKAGAKAPRLVSIGGTALRRMNVAIAG